ncbi:thiosulfate dehydrogenase [quinone] large subunit [Halopelagius inordinatus]|uniref:Thiosulfate dehydrogenase [quinone] large subunit n=1 Tax=Halopelagius inordinatus TaxID=553467 RepID=A0A1I2LTS9_9EURY|nr:TQO small subunit DoxD [Halopelagius inordinatus]SFF80867.1 thiosulfate dehydrogenase [quinone] large subunit [Halopelagius inordinatus]
MATTQHTDAGIDLSNALDFELGGTLAGYWTAVLRIVVGYWFLHSGVGKLMAPEAFDASGWMLNATASPIHGFLVWAAQTPWLLEFTNVMVPIGEALIGLGLVVGALVRLASFFGAFLMVFFYLGNADWAHGLVNGDLMGLLLFVTLGVLGAGRVLGLDALLEQTRFGKTRLAKYLLG